MAKRPDSFEEFQRKQATKRAMLPPLTHNYPDLPSLSHEELTSVETARGALMSLKKTFERWVEIGRGLKTLKDKSERIGGRFTFDQLREREGLGGRDKSSGVEILNKSRVSRLLAILDNLSAVEKWRSGLKPRERFDWASPEAIHNHCPVFGKKTRTGPSPYAQLQAANIKLQEDLDKALKREDGDTFNPKTSAPSEIAVALVGALAPYRGKAEKVWRELGALVKPKRDQEDSK